MSDKPKVAIEVSGINVGSLKDSDRKFYRTMATVSFSMWRLDESRKYDEPIEISISISNQNGLNASETVALARCELKKKLQDLVEILEDEHWEGLS